MARVKRGVIAGRRHKKVLAKAKGYYNARRKVYRTAKQAVIKAGQYAYRDRKAKKRDFRALWITRINAAARGFDLSYSRLMAGLKAAGLESIARCLRTSRSTTSRRSARSPRRPRRVSGPDRHGDCPRRGLSPVGGDCPRQGLSPKGTVPTQRLPVVDT